LSCNYWWNGTPWLLTPESEWSNFEQNMSETVQKEVEAEIVIKKPRKETSLLQTTSVKTVEDMTVNPLTKLLRITALALKFIRKLEKNVNEKQFITGDGIRNAEEMWIKSVQRNWYQDVFYSIDHHKRHNLQVQLDVFVDKTGLLRCKGRLENAGITDGARFPILLPQKDKFTCLLIETTHKELLHSGVSQCLSTVRNRFWIPHGRATIKSMIKLCTVCRRHEGCPYKMPPMSQLPVSRVTVACPFTRIGIDYFGPIFIKTVDENRKVWVCLFTCLVTRALHLELVSDMTKSEFLLCFRLLIAQRGTPVEIISNNAKQFKSASSV
jgi:hypothetical protein